MRPPIASPSGEPENVSDDDKSERVALGISICFRYGASALGRKIYKEMLTDLTSIAATLLVTTILTAIIHPVFGRTHSSQAIPFLQLWLFFFCIFPLSTILIVMPFAFFDARRAKTVILTPYGVTRCEGKKEVEIPWSSFFGITHWSGDVILTTLATSTVIPREAFASREETQEFVQIARELRKSRGAAWRDEWKGKVFGQKPENWRPNLPK